MNNEIRLFGSCAPEVNIKEICLCSQKDKCVHNEELDICFDVIARIKLSGLPDLVRQIHELDGLGWKHDEGKTWEVVIREVKKYDRKEMRT